MTRRHGGPAVCAGIASSPSRIDRSVGDVLETLLLSENKPDGEPRFGELEPDESSRRSPHLHELTYRSDKLLDIMRPSAVADLQSIASGQ